MNIIIIQGFSLDKKYGTELNRIIETLPDDSHICCLDIDCMFLSHKQIPLMYEYILRHQNTGLFLATSNRSGSRNAQRYNNEISKNYDMAHWMKIADEMPVTYTVSTPIKNFISGYLMLFSKKTWMQNKFSEERNVLHVDRDFAQGVLDLGKPIHIMNDILVWHSYRLLQGTHNTKHLL